jgi:HAE1 family hydrophobic/amphiphilic exporter-1
VNQGQVFVRIAPHEQRVFSFTRLARGLARLDPLEALRGNYSQRELMQQVRQRMRQFRDLRVAVRNVQSFSLGGPPVDIDFSIRGPELEQLASYGEHLRQRAPEIGLQDADTTLKLDKPELRVEIDRARAADLGVSVQDVATALRVMVGGDQEVTRFRDPAVNDDYDVELRLDEKDRIDPAVIARLYVPRAGGGLVRLDNVVRIDRARSPSRVDRLDRQRVVSLRAGVAPGYAQADRVAALREEFRLLDAGPAYSTAVSGRSRELEQTGREFLWAFLLSIAFMYMILAAQFESLVHPLTILLSLPVAVPFALLSLWATGNTLNLYSALGMLVLFGVVKKNSILQIDYMLTLRRRGVERLQAIMQANRDRLRPILMTTLSLVAGMLPLAAGTGPGAEERRTIAVVVIGGQMLALVLTLLLTPVAYSVFDDMAHTVGWQRLAARLSRAVASWRPKGSEV